MVQDVDPVSYVLPFSVDWDLEVFLGSYYGFGYEFLGELVGAEVVCASCYDDVQSVGSVVCLAEHVCCCLGRGVWV